MTASRIVCTCDYRESYLISSKTSMLMSIFTSWNAVAIIIDIMFWDFLILYQILFSSVTNTYRHGIHESPHELLNEI